MRFALFFGNRAFMPAELIKDARQEMVEAVTSAGYEYLITDETLTRYGAVEIREEGRLYAEWLKSHEGEYDGVILCQLIFIDENGAITALSDANVPILMQAYPDEIGKMDFAHRRDAFCGKFSVTDVFEQYRIPYTVMPPHVAHSSQVTPPQRGFRKMAAISANCVTAVTPEQSAIWSYPLEGAHDEQVIFNMVNAMLLRVHLSGGLANLSPSGKSLVKEGVLLYKNIRSTIKHSKPMFISELRYYNAPWLSFGLRSNNKILVAIWNLNNTDYILIDMPSEITGAQIIYPSAVKTGIRFSGRQLVFRTAAPYTTRLAEIILK